MVGGMGRRVGVVMVTAPAASFRSTRPRRDDGLPLGIVGLEFHRSDLLSSGQRSSHTGMAGLDEVAAVDIWSGTPPLSYVPLEHHV